MRKMKDSGIEWIGEIPEEWEVKKGRYLFIQRTDKGNTKNLQLLSPSQKYGVIPQYLLEQLTTQTTVKLKETTDLNELKTVHQGDFCISLRSFQGGFEYSEYEGVVSPAYQIFYKRQPLVNKYYKYIFKDSSFISKINSYTLSLRDGKNISYFDFGNTYLPLPSIEEQQQIADYLDARCAEIDATLEDIQKEINILEDYKKSVITEAVTKGLDPNAEMKDSGIEWIGEIPKEWQIKRFKYVATIEPCLVNPEKYLTYNQIAPDSIEKNTGKLILKRTVEEAAVDSWNHFFHKGQIIYSKIRPVLNKLIIAPYCGLCSADMYPITAKENVQFLYYEMLSNFFVNQVALVTRDRIKMPKINQEELGNILIVLPPSKIQQQIADYLNTRCSEIDALIADKKKQLELLADYKKSLIYEYVTGKKEVPTQG